MNNDLFHNGSLNEADELQPWTSTEHKGQLKTAISQENTQLHILVWSDGHSDIPWMQYKDWYWSTQSLTKLTKLHEFWPHTYKALGNNKTIFFFSLSVMAINSFYGLKRSLSTDPHLSIQMFELGTFETELLHCFLKELCKLNIVPSSVHSKKLEPFIAKNRISFYVLIVVYWKKTPQTPHTKIKLKTQKACFKCLDQVTWQLWLCFRKQPEKQS